MEITEYSHFFSGNLVKVFYWTLFIDPYVPGHKPELFSLSEDGALHRFGPALQIRSLLHLLIYLQPELSQNQNVSEDQSELHRPL